MSEKDEIIESESKELVTNSSNKSWVSSFGRIFVAVERWRIGLVYINGSWLYNGDPMYLKTSFAYIGIFLKNAMVFILNKVFRSNQKTVKDKYKWSYIVSFYTIRYCKYIFNRN